MRGLMLFLMTVLGACGIVDFGTGHDAANTSQPQTPVASTQATVPEQPAAALPDATLPPPIGAGSSLGRTVVSLGDPAEAGMWLKTPLVSTERPGQVRYRGVVVAVTLQPLDAEIGAGSQMSVRAMQALGASLSELVEVEVEAT